MKKAVTAVLLCLLVLIALSFACAEGDSGIHLPSSLIVLENEVFAGTAVEEVYLPRSLAAVSERAFADAENLEAIRFSGNTLMLPQGGVLRISGCRTSPGKEEQVGGRSPVFCADQHTDRSEKSKKKKTEHVPAGEMPDGGAAGNLKGNCFAENRYICQQERPELPPVDYIFP